jgi:uncharacterized membrane protein YbhN (UPF0104 family)
VSTRRLILFLFSIVAAIVLIGLLIRVGRIDLLTVGRQLRSVSHAAFLKLVLLNVALVYLSTQKWRTIDAVLRSPSDAVPSWITSLAVTSGGLAIGLILPTPIGMVAARTVGAYPHGRPLKRGTAGTVFEQSFDLLIVVLLAVASGITWYYGGGWLMWCLSAGAIVTIALLLVGPTISAIRRWLPCGRSGASGNRIIRGLQELQRPDLLNSGLARRLTMLSAARFGVVVLMAEQTAVAIGAHIPLWQMAAAVPFVVVTTIISVTPGGIGLNELTYATALHHFGTSLDVAAQWSLANRILATASCIVVAVCSIAIRGIANATAPTPFVPNSKVSAERT